MRAGLHDSSPLKILFIIRYFHPYIGGLEKQTLSLASAMIERGINAEVLTSKFYRSWPKQEVIKGVPVCRLPSPRIKIVGAVIFLFCLFIHIIKRRSDFDCIHAFQVGYSSALAIFMGRLLRKTTVLNLAGSGRGGDIRRHIRSPWGWVFLALCRLASRVVILNREMGHELRAIWYDEQAIVHIPNGVDLNVFKRASHKKLQRKKMGIDNGIIIMYTGRLAREKGVDFLIRACANLTPTSTPFKLYIIGNGPKYSGIKKLISRYHLEDSVIMLPAAEEVMQFLQIADIFIMPSLYEGMSNSVLEAMACGLPVIATNVSGNMELIVHDVTGLLVDRNDERHLTQAILYLMTHPEKACQLGDAAQTVAQNNFSMDTITERYISLYRSLTLIKN